MIGKLNLNSFRIDKNTEEGLHNIEKGRKSLLRAYKTVSSNRSLILKVYYFKINKDLSSFNIIFYHLYFIFTLIWS